MPVMDRGIAVVQAVTGGRALGAHDAQPSSYGSPGCH